MDWQTKPEKTQVIIGKTRKDGKIPVKFIFTGKTLNKLVGDYDEALAIKHKFEK